MFRFRGGSGRVNFRTMMNMLTAAVLALCGTQDAPKEKKDKDPKARPACECACEAPKPPAGNNGVGNGVDPQPPGQPPVNDGVDAGQGRPGNKPPKDKEKGKDADKDKHKDGRHGETRPEPPDRHGKTCECRCHGGSPGSTVVEDGKGRHRPKGNNGVGNGEDPQPPGNPPVNDGPGAGPGKPGNRGGAKK
jgi:hypothetical protein